MILPPENEEILLKRVNHLAGLSLGQLDAMCVEHRVRRFHKGWVGQLLEHALGATAGSLPEPDFKNLSIELKTLPLGKHGHPIESTFVASIDLRNIIHETWETSWVARKLKRVLWIPVEGDRTIPLLERRLGMGFLWSPSLPEENVLRQDWCELTEYIALGNFSEITARYGQYLQIRPKAADGRSLCWGWDDAGEKIQTLPRGFYLRACFTKRLLQRGNEQSNL